MFSFDRLCRRKTLTTCCTSRAMTESLQSIGLIGVSGGERTLRRRDERSIRAPLNDSSASVLFSIFTTRVSFVLVKVSREWPEGLFQRQNKKRVCMFCPTTDADGDVARVRTILVVVFLLNENVISKKLTLGKKEREEERHGRRRNEKRRKEGREKKQALLTGSVVIWPRSVV